MKDTTTARRGRPPKGATALSSAAIVGAALTIIETEGSESVSMRAVARALGVDAKSLYNHVSGKDGLLDAVADHILGTIELPHLVGDTATDLKAIANAFRTVALTHPRAAALVLTRQSSTANGLQPVEVSLQVLLDAGLEPSDAVHTLRVLLATVIGTLLREVNASPTFGTTDHTTMARRTATLASSGMPHIAVAASTLATFDGDEEYRFTLDFLVDSITARSHPTSEILGP